jgi:hypothetical protein
MPEQVKSDDCLATRIPNLKNRSKCRVSQAKSVREIAVFQILIAKSSLAGTSVGAVVNHPSPRKEADPRALALGPAAEFRRSPEIFFLLL